eukprot:293852-Ditylum_brightwellii.AAC.1
MPGIPDAPQVPNPHPHPSSRIESVTDEGVEAGTGLQRYRESNNDTLAIADPNSVLPSPNTTESIVKPGTNADKEENPNTTTETTGRFQDK